MRPWLRGLSERKARVNALGLEPQAELRNLKEINVAGAEKQGQEVGDEVSGVALKLEAVQGA